jgi:hypothetical protein
LRSLPVRRIQLLSDAGYATALYGKWHLEDTHGRLPNDQGYDEWWGMPNSLDEAGDTAWPLFKESGVPVPMIWEGKKGEPSKPVMRRRQVAPGVSTCGIRRREAQRLAKIMSLELGSTAVHTGARAISSFHSWARTRWSQANEPYDVILMAVVILPCAQGGAQWCRC